MSRQLDKLASLVEKKNQEENAAKKRIEDQLQERLDVIKGMMDRIHDALEIGDLLVKNKLRFGGSPERLWSTEYDNYVGFVGTPYGYMCAYSVYGIGIGNCKFYVKDGCQSYGNYYTSTERKIELLDRFIAEFPEFERELHQYIDSLETV